MPGTSVKELDEQIATLQRQRDEAVSKARADARARIEAILAEAETSLEEVFPKLSSRRPGRKPTAPQKPRQAGPLKYIVDSKPLDGRAARRHPAFAKVLKGNKIDDIKAAAAGLVNPEWAKEQPERVLKAMKMGPTTKARRRGKGNKAS